MEGIRYCQAGTGHGPWWYAWSIDGVVASAQGWLSEDEFLERLGAIGATVPTRGSAHEIPEHAGPTRLSGAFQRRVLEECARIPEGEVRTYGQLAKACGNPRSARAVGSAMAMNPCPGVVPCHRVVRADGQIGHYSAGGSEQKKRMLKAEGVSIVNGRVRIKGER